MAGEKVIERLRAEAALPSTYQRGVAIWRDGGVLKLAKNGGELGSTVGLRGRVAGSDGGYYSVSVDLDTESQKHKVPIYLSIYLTIYLSLQVQTKKPAKTPVILVKKGKQPPPKPPTPTQQQQQQTTTKSTRSAGGRDSL